MGRSGPSDEEQEAQFQQQIQLQNELAKQKEEQQSQLEEAQKRRKSLLRNQLGGAGSLIPGSDSGQTLGG